MTAQDHGDAVSGVSRRDLLKKGAVVGVTAAWTIPLVQVVSMTPAHADSPSAPPGPPTNNPPPPPGTTIPVTPTEPSTTSNTSTAASSSSAAAPTESSRTETVTPKGGGTSVTGGPLASTGSNTLPAIGIGAAAVALGVGALAASQVGRPKRSNRWPTAPNSSVHC